MINIKPVSDLRNKYPEIEKEVNEGQTVYLTKNGYGSMIILSLEKYAELCNGIEHKQDEAAFVAESSELHYSHEIVFDAKTTDGSIKIPKKYSDQVDSNVRVILSPIRSGAENKSDLIPFYGFDTSGYRFDRSEANER